jgi:tetratricopeptide (TPR) repeat protein
MTMNKLLLTCALILSVATTPLFAKGLDDAKAGLELAQIGLDDVAIESFQEALKDKSLSAQEKEKTYYNLGTLYLRGYAPSLALKNFDAALKIAPQETRTLINRAEALRMMGKDKEALKVLDQALSINPKLDAAFYARGLSLLAVKNTHEAQEAFGDALAIKDDNPFYYIGLGRSYLQEKNYKKAFDAFDDAIDEDSTMAYGYLYRSMAYVGLGKKRKAGDDLIKAVQTAPNDPFIQSIYRARRFNERPMLYVTTANVNALAAPNAKAPVFTRIPKDMMVIVPTCDKKGWCRVMLGDHLAGYTKKASLKSLAPNK